MHSIYCPTCHVLLMKAKAVYGQIKCHKCKELVDLRFIMQSAYEDISRSAFEDLLTTGKNNNKIKGELLKRSVEPRSA